MQRITIEIPDDVFDAFNKSAKQMGEKFAETMGDFVSSNPYFSDVRQTMCDNAVSLDEWKKERGVDAESFRGKAEGCHRNSYNMQWHG